jgi:hypothetical protein
MTLERSTERRQAMLGLRVRRFVVLIAVVTATTLGMTACSSQSAGAVTLESANNAGADPFSASVAIGPAVSFPGNVVAITTAARKGRSVDKKTHTLVAPGTAPGLYGGSGDAHVCDADQLVTFLSQHPDKAAAWAGVLGIASTNIKSYVASLTPVVLTADTLVTNHGYRNGRATTLQSVLQAGTAVMVDNTGTPRVKCNCGNPLTPPQPINVTSAHVSGAQWAGYSSSAITRVQPGLPTKEFTLTDIRTGDPYSVAAGSNAGQWVAADAMPYGNTTTILTSADARTWSPATTIPGVAVTAIAYGNGTWVAAADTQQNPQSGSQILESKDLKTWTKVADNLFHIGGVAYGNGRWVAVGAGIAGVAVGGLNHASRVEYSSTDGSNWSGVDISNLDVTDANMQQLEAVAFGDGKWIAAGIDERDDPSGQSNSVVTLKTFTSTDGIKWSAGTHWNSNVRPTQSGGGTATIVHGNGQWLAGASTVGGGALLHASADGQTWTDVPGTQFGQQALEAMTFGSSSYLAAGLAAGPQDGSGPSRSTFYTSPNGTSWTAASDRASFISAVAFGPEVASTSTPTTPSASSAPCRNEFMWTPIKQVIAPNAIPNLSSVKAHCSGDWGYVTFGMVTGSGAYTLTVHWNGRAWEPATDACAQGQLPPDIKGPACSGTAPTASNTAPSVATTTTTSGGSASSAPCTKAAFQSHVNPGSTIAEVWCGEGWAVVDSRSADAEDLVAYRANGTSWQSVAQFECDIVPAGFPTSLLHQVCQGG